MHFSALPGLRGFGALGLLAAHSQLVSAVKLPSSYDVVWTSQSENSAGSMPVGGGDIGLNAWAEDGDILFYIQKSGTFDENNSFPKLGRVRLTLDPNPFESGDFEQRLLINDGYVRFIGNDNTTVNLWVDVFNPVIHVEIDCPNKASLTASYENWRHEDYIIRKGEQAQSSWGVGYNARIPEITSYADTIAFKDQGVQMSHRNEKQPLFDFQVKQQKLSGFADELYNPMLNNEFGLWMHSPQLKPGKVTTGSYVNTTYKAWPLVSSGRKHKSFNLAIALHQDQADSHREWEKGLKATINKAMKHTQEKSIAWWHQYWDRSYIIINEDAGAKDAGFQVGKNYQLWRYMMGCNAYSEWPTKFNGGIHTFDPVFVNPQMPFTPDYRRWGGGTFTVQNQRLLYWPLLRSGDFDVMKSQFEFYRRITDNGLLIGKHFFDVNATHFTEQIDNNGLPNVFEYDGNDYRFNISRAEDYPVGETWSSWLAFLQDTANEIADMILLANSYGGFDVRPYLPFIEHQLAWFDQFYQKQNVKHDVFPLNGVNGGEKLVLYPAAAAETYLGAYNPSSTISGLRKLIRDILDVGEFEIQPRKYYEEYLQRIPEIPLRSQQGRTTIAPALAWSRIRNSEIPQLYPVFPWGEYGLGMPNLTVALDTWYYDTEVQGFKENYGWKQGVIWLARMGVTNEATKLTEERYADSKDFRFPVFKGPHFDWVPDMNHYGSSAIGLQEQLMQTTVGDSIRLLGAWPDHWNARFKLWAPGNTTVAGTVERGEVGDLVVEPKSRENDIVYKAD
ncbi:hypothetical protein CC79DRAFT_1280853 [Sarocladium strictum]